MKKLFNIFLVLGTITILFIGLYTTQPHNYYLFLRWYIFLYSIYLISNFSYPILILKEKSDFYMVFVIVISLILISMAIIYNPFMSLTFLKKTRKIIDFVILLIALFISIRRGIDYIKSLSPKGKIILRGLLGLAVTFVVIWLAFYGTVKFYHEFLLITKASTANGFIISSGEQRDDKGDSLSFDVYFVYTFKTKDGKTFKDHSSVSIPISGYLSEANVKPIPIEVEYISDNPKIHRIKGMTSQPTTIGRLILNLSLIALFLFIFYSIGFRKITHEIKNYLKEVKEIMHKGTISDNE